jgi:peptide/nickel transport system permease protein
MLRTILPNIMGPQIVQLVVTAASAVVVAASLNYLGLGVPPPAPSWGAMLQASQSYLLQNPWYGIFPGVALAATVLLLDRIGSGVQQATGGARSASRKSLRGRLR